MPNHISHIVKVTKGNYDLTKNFKSFNDIIPMPKELDIACTYPEEGTELYNQYQSNKEKYGFENWYKWCIHNWGTKWDMYEVNNISESELIFDTAWNTPLKVFEVLAKELTDGVEIEVVYADEDVGHNSGRIFIKDGKATTNAYASNSDEAYEAYIQTHKDTELCKCDDGKYRYVLKCKTLDKALDELSYKNNLRIVMSEDDDSEEITITNENDSEHVIYTGEYVSELRQLIQSKLKHDS